MPCTEWVGFCLHLYPWKRRPNSLFIASSHRSPAADLRSSLYSAKVPVSGLMAADADSGAVILGLLLIGLLATPRVGASLLFSGCLFWDFLVGVCCCCNVLKKLISWVWWLDSSVLTNVLVGGLCSSTMASSTAAGNRSRLSSLGKVQRVQPNSWRALSLLYGLWTYGNYSYCICTVNQYP